MKYNPDVHHRQSIRLKGYDYSQAGAYFVTICTQKRQHLFGEIVNGEMQLNDAGGLAHQCWDAIPVHFPNVDLDQFVVMPNHVHGIIWIIDNVGAKHLSPLQCGTSHRAKHLSPLQCGTSQTIGSIVRGFKIGVNKWMRKNTDIHEVWQRNYWEHILRNDDELNRIRQYIRNNPKNWETDKLNGGPGNQVLEPPPP